MFEFKGNNVGSFFWTPFFPMLYLVIHLEYTSTHSLCPAFFKRQFLTFKEHPSILFLRKTPRILRTAFPLFAFAFLFLRETSYPSKLCSCSGSELPLSLSFLPSSPRGEFGVQISSPAELELLIPSSKKLMHHFYLYIHNKYLMFLFF